MEDKGEIRLNQLPVGSLGRILGLETKGLMRRRLLDLGFVPGTVVETVRRSPLGDPTAFKIRGALIALRSEEGRQIRVKLL
ncbi:MAG TPA: ferrous iron transport protein A [Clostridia bacterium]|jgi:ferrous iron transport protein A|nr:ferrous iron transport protein A [Clostridia bacterium]